MSKLLLVLAVLCFAVAAQADTTTISAAFFTSGVNTCQGTNYTTTYTAGACLASAGTGTAYYCAADGSNVYVVTFSDASCNATYVQSISQLSTKCGGAVGNFQYTCVNPSAGPALPSSWTFPPAGWNQATTCFNNTAIPYTPQCGGSLCISSASLPVGCRKTQMSNQPSALSGCSSTDSSNSYTVYYSDSNCAGSVVGAVSTPYTAGCDAKSGTTGACPSITLPASMPSVGYKLYDNDGCDGTTNKPSTVLFYPGQCFSSQTVACSTNVNGTTVATLNAWSGTQVVNGTCSGDNSTNTYPVGQCNARKIFTCSAGPTPPGPTGAASATGASMVAMVLAAIVALIASLSL